jgi:uncharacterized protein (TIGR03437 family)
MCRRLLWFGFAVFLASSHAIGQSGPTLVGSGYGSPPYVSVAPGQVLTLWVAGLKAISPSTSNATMFPLSTSLAGISVTLNQIQRAFSQTLAVPLISVAQTNLCGDPSNTAQACLLTAITGQIPFELVSDPFTSPPPSSLVVSQDGVSSQSFFANTVEDNVHVLMACGGGYPGTCVTHADGSLVSSELPAQPGETVVIYAVGLGHTVPTIASGQPTPEPAPTVGGVLVNFDFHCNAGPSRPAGGNARQGIGVSPAFAGLTPGQVGLYQINVQLPAAFPAVQTCPESGAYYPAFSNLTINIAGPYFSYDGAAIWVQRGQ